MRLVRDPAPDQSEIVELRAALDAFYRDTVVYTAFQETTDRSDFYAAALACFGDVRRPLRVLEVGAGRTGLPAYLRKVGRSDISVTAQDVTPANLDYLTQECTAVHIGDVSAIASASFDLVLHSYVFEHVSAPREFLNDIARILSPGGWHALVCPRYDMPGYVCPSLRHLSRVQQWAGSARLAASRSAAMIDGRERFWVNCDPAVLHKPWFRDADAVHLVSRGDAERWHERNGFDDVRRLALGRDANGKTPILFKLLTVAMAARKKPV